MAIIIKMGYRELKQVSWLEQTEVWWTSGEKTGGKMKKERKLKKSLNRTGQRSAI